MLFWKCLVILGALAVQGQEDRVRYRGTPGLPGNGVKVVLLAGDEEYRSEEAMPALARILSLNHGFETVVLFSQDEDGIINPDNASGLPGLEELHDADLIIMLWRFRAPSDPDMKIIDDYVNSGRPIIGVRTSTHAFDFTAGNNPDSIYRSFYHFAAEGGGFGRRVLGEQWIAHWGDHAIEATRGLIAVGQENNPIVNGISPEPSNPNSVYGPSDVYQVDTFFEFRNNTSIIDGQVLTTLDPLSEPNPDKETMSVVWSRPFVGPTFTGTVRNVSPVVTSTIGSAIDMESLGVRRILVNAVYDLLDMEVPELADVSVGFDFDPTFYGFGTYVQGMRPDDFTDPSDPIPPFRNAV